MGTRKDMDDLKEQLAPVQLGYGELYKLLSIVTGKQGLQQIPGQPLHTFRPPPGIEILPFVLHIKQR